MPSIEQVRQGTERRERIVAAVSTWKQSHSYGPTIRELCAIERCSVATMAKHVDILVEEGRLTRGPERSQRTLGLP